ncbi:hypothetical protein FB45DRAFT_935763 [Roridomyces roridus]|uniref:F-box domain-containing protein n=1 Tax=Roridomyces roridus TaxID=1738132 RepID=A0AAD7BAX3_9AGAR|nr:hypothetical protein FB45DRAFT_935763 [Roridomyces roridus]
MSDLPQELVDAVVDEIDDHEALEAFSLVSRSFVSSCQRRLFHTIRFEDARSLRAITQKFTSCPHLRSYVQVLQIGFLFSTKHLKAVASLVGMLQDLRRMTWGMWMDKMKPKYLIRAMKRSLRNPSMQCLTLDACSVPPSVLSYAAAFTSELHLGMVGLDLGSEPPSTRVPRARTNLKELSHLTMGAEQRRGRVARALLPHLGALQKYEDDLSSMTIFNLVVGATCKTLEHLQLREIPFRRLRRLARIPHRPRMESLRFLGIDLREDVSELSLTRIFSTLPKPSEVPRLETLSLLIAPADMLLPVPKSDLPVDWEAYECLCQINVDFRWSYEEPDEEAILAAYIHRQPFPSRIRVCVSNRMDEDFPL